MSTLKKTQIKGKKSNTTKSSEQLTTITIQKGRGIERKYYFYESSGGDPPNNSMNNLLSMYKPGQATYGILPPNNTSNKKNNNNNLDPPPPYNNNNVNENTYKQELNRCKNEYGKNNYEFSQCKRNAARSLCMTNNDPLPANYNNCPKQKLEKLNEMSAGNKNNKKGGANGNNNRYSNCEGLNQSKPNGKESNYEYCIKDRNERYEQNQKNKIKYAECEEYNEFNYQGRAECRNNINKNNN